MKSGSKVRILREHQLTKLSKLKKYHNCVHDCTKSLFAIWKYINFSSSLRIFLKYNFWYAKKCNLIYGKQMTVVTFISIVHRFLDFFLSFHKTKCIWNEYIIFHKNYYFLLLFVLMILFHKFYFCWVFWTPSCLVEFFCSYFIARCVWGWYFDFNSYSECILSFNLLISWKYLLNLSRFWIINCLNYFKVATSFEIKLLIECLHNPKVFPWNPLFSLATDS